MSKEQLDRDQFRRITLQGRDSLPARSRMEKSELIREKVLALPEVRKAQVMLVYMHFRSEVRTLELIRGLLSAGKSVALPVTNPGNRSLLTIRITDPEAETEPGFCGIPEPLEQLWQKRQLVPAEIEAVIVPGSVFDRQGGRLGYGGGYYDRFLTNQAPGALKIGLAFEVQLVERVPMAPHDQFMDYVISEQQIYCCRRDNHA